jgi:NAD(P)-dependent dehydrogenase (short-subunit alcohol dehydrogenase family)
MEIQRVSAVVSGGASGLGFATALALADGGADVYALDLDTACDAVDGSSLGSRSVTFLPTDITDASQVASAVAAAGASAYPLRVAVNCAGIGPSQRILGREGVNDPQFFFDVVHVNLFGTYNVMAHAAAVMAEQDALEDGLRGVVINTASVAAFEGQIGQAAYSASKAGVVGMTLPAARDLARAGIRVNTIAPGIVETPMLATVPDEYRAGLADGVPFPKRLGRPDEYASLVLALIAHDYINAETIRMDAGLRMASQ